MWSLPVVRIVWPANAEYGGFVEINESDFDPKIHKLFVESEVEQQAESPKRRGRKPKEKAE